MKNSTLLLTLFTITLSAKQVNAAKLVKKFSPRTQTECSDLQVENVVDWFKDHDDLNRLNERIGEPRHQLDVGWCFSYTARDLIHFGTDIDPSLGIITKDYYTGFLGTISGFFTKNEGGFIYTNVKRAYQNGICEAGFIDKYATPKNVETVNCTRRRVSIKKYGHPKKHQNTHMGRGHALYPQLDEYLAEGQMVGISYNAEGLYKKKYRRAGMIKKRLANHASSIVGRYFDKARNVCRYIIRNSWGTRVNYSLAGPQKEGYHTITEEDLAQSLSDLNVFR